MGKAYERAALAQHPVWMTGSPAAASARLRDREDELLKAGVSMRCPIFCPDDALFHLGATRALEQAPGETPAAFRARCGRAHEIWAWAGTKRGLQEIFEPFGVSADDVKVWNDHETTYGEDPSTAWWSKVWLFVDSTAGPWTDDGLWDGAGIWDDGGLWDCSMTAAELEYVRREVRRKKNDAAYPAMLFLAVQETHATPEGAWDDGAIWDDNGRWDEGQATPPVVPLVLGHLWEEEQLFFDAGPGSWDEPGDVWDDFA